MQKKKVTIQDIADEANVSKSTVSRVLNKSTVVNDLKRAAVLKAMKALDFQPNLMARSLAGGKSMTIGVLTQDIGSPFYDLVARGVTFGLRNTDYSPIFVDGQWSAEVEEASLATLLGRRVDGIILIGGNMTTEELKQVEEQKPLVIVARELPDWPDSCIFLDNLNGAYQATKFLIDSGHKEIAFIGGIEAHQDSKRRREGFEKAMDEAGLAVDQDLCVAGNFQPDSGAVAAETLLERGKPFTAIFASNDEMAFGARLALHQNGIAVPDQVSLIGFDDQPLSAFMTPPLTTVRQPAHELGVAAAAKLVTKLEDGTSDDTNDLQTKLIIRQSVRTL